MPDQLGAFRDAALALHDAVVRHEPGVRVYHAAAEIDRPGRVHVLPALPAAWPSGSVRGLCARGGLTLDFTWSGGTVRALSVHSRREQEIELVAGPGEPRRVALVAGSNRVLSDRP